MIIKYEFKFNDHDVCGDNNNYNKVEHAAAHQS